MKSLLFYYKSRGVGTRVKLLFVFADLLFLYLLLVGREFWELSAGGCSRGVPNDLARVGVARG